MPLKVSNPPHAPDPITLSQLQCKCEATVKIPDYRVEWFYSAFIYILTVLCALFTPFSLVCTVQLHRFQLSTSQHHAHKFTECHQPAQCSLMGAFRLALHRI
jgi:hypothetical protein